MGRVDRIVVGVDGSASSIQALRWAVGEARASGGSVLVLWAWEWMFHEDAQQPDVPFDPNRQARDDAHLLSGWVDRARQDAPNVDIEERLVRDLPVRALLDASSEADLVVVGSRGRGGFRGLLLGSVSQQCIQYSAVPVAIVRADRPDEPFGRIVVGVDGSPESRHALDWALAIAGRKGAELEVFHSWQFPFPPGDFFPTEDVKPYEQSTAEALVQDMLDAADTTDLRFPVIRTVELGSPRVTLIDASTRADLLVVGSRGVGGFRGMLLGSVAHAIAHHADCPVLVVPGPGARSNGS